MPILRTAPWDKNEVAKGVIRIRTFNKILWAYPLIVIAAQLLPWEYSLAIGITFVVAGFTKSFRALLLFGFTTLGHLIWFFISQQLATSISNRLLLIILGRFGLLGYIILFVLWERFQPCENRLLQLGNMKEQLKFPLIWRGFDEYVWRFILIFCTLCLAAIVFFCLENNRISIVPYGLLFATINSILEEILWRGFILGRTADFLEEKRALILTSLAFGVYHLSLGFSIWVCLAFAIGGFYMGGCVIKSKGLGASIIMHLFVNMVFVSCDIIF